MSGAALSGGSALRAAPPSSGGRAPPIGNPPHTTTMTASPLSHSPLQSLNTSLLESEGVGDSLSKSAPNSLDRPSSLGMSVLISDVATNSEALPRAQMEMATTVADQPKRRPPPMKHGATAPVIFGLANPFLLPPSSPSPSTPSSFGGGSRLQMLQQAAMLHSKATSPRTQHGGGGAGASAHNNSLALYGGSLHYSVPGVKRHYSGSGPASGGGVGSSSNDNYSVGANTTAAAVRPTGQVPSSYPTSTSMSMSVYPRVTTPAAAAAAAAAAATNNNNNTANPKRPRRVKRQQKLFRMSKWQRKPELRELMQGALRRLHESNPGYRKQKPKEGERYIRMYCLRRHNNQALAVRYRPLTHMRTHTHTHTHTRARTRTRTCTHTRTDPFHSCMSIQVGRLRPGTSVAGHGRNREGFEHTRASTHASQPLQDIARIQNGHR